MAFTAEYIYRILDNYSGPLDRISRSTKKFQGMANRAADKVKKLSKRLEGAGNSMANFRTMIGGAAITAGMYKFAQNASTMHDAMADVERVTGLTGMELDRMQAKLQVIGRETGRSAEGLAAIAYEGGKLGIANDKMVEFVMMVTKTGAAFDMADAEAGRAIGSIRAKLGLSVGSVNELMQRINFLADNTSAAGDQMIEIVERTSGTFKTLNIPPEVTAGWAAFANQMEVSPELAASGLNQMMAKMMQMPGMLSKMLKDPKNAVSDFLKRFKGLPEAKRGVAILKTFGMEAGRFVLKAVANTKLLDEAMQKAAASEALGSMDREFANILARSSTAGKRIKETFIDISRAIGTVFLGVFDRYSDRLIRVSGYVLDFVKAHPGLVKIAAVFGLILIAISAVVIPLGLIFSIVAAGLPIWAAMLTGMGALFGAMSGTLPTMGAFGAAGSGIVAPFLAVAAAIAAVTAATYQLWKHWDTLSAPGFLKDLKGFVTEGVFGRDESVASTLAATRARSAAAYKSSEIGLAPAQDKAAGRAQNNKMEISGQIGVTASGGAEVESANINLNAGYNLAAGGV